MTDRKYLTIEGAAGRPIQLDLTLAKKSVASPLVIFVHGFKGFKDWGTHNLMADYFAERGFDFLKFNFSHNGTNFEYPGEFADLVSFGLNTFSKELYDLERVISFATSGEKSPIPLSVNLIGHSRGGGISIIKTAEDKRINKVVTWASVSNFRNLWKMEQEETWKKEGVIYVENARTKQQMPLNITLLEDFEENEERLNILKAASKIGIPWLIVHGLADTSVPVEKALQLLEQNKSAKLELIPEADHVFNARHPWKEHFLPEKLEDACERTALFLQG